MAGAPGPPAPEAGYAKPSVLERIADVVSRVNYAEVAFLESLMRNEGIGEAFKAGFTDFFSGIGGLEGQKRTWGDFLEARGFGGGRVSDALEWFYNEDGKGWRPKKGGVFDPTLRGFVGLGLDIGLDPTTYLTLGTGLARTAHFGEPIAGIGKAVKFSLSGKGERALARTTEELLPSGAIKKYMANALTREQMPEALRFAHDLRLGGTIDKVSLKQAREVVLYADQVAQEAAQAKIYRLIEEGAKELAHPGGIGFRPPFAKDTITLLKGEKFKPIGTAASRTLRWMEDLSPGDRFYGLANAFLDTGRSLDSLFNEVKRGARNIAGVTAAKAAYNGEVVHSQSILRHMLDEWTKGWDKMKPIDDPVGYFGKEGKLTVDEYVALTLQNPARYPKDALPQAVQDLLPRFRTWLDQSWTIEASTGLIKKAAYRKDYVPLQLRNTVRQIEKIDTVARQRRPSFVSGRGTLGPYKEVRSFNTFEDAYEFGKQLQKEGIIKFDLVPEVRFSKLMHTRGLTHIQAMAMKNFEARALVHYGLDRHFVRQKIFEKLLPDVQKFANEMLSESQFDDLVEAIESLVLEKKPNLGKLSDEGKGLYWLAKMRTAKNFDELMGTLYRHRREISEISPKASSMVMEAAGTYRRQFLNSFSEPFVRIPSGHWEGSFMPKPIWETMGHLKESVLNEKEVRSMITAYDWLMDAFKAGVTAIFPAFHVRNAYSNVAQNFVDIGLTSLNPVRAWQVAAIMAGRDGTIKMGRLGRWTYEEVRQLMLEHGIIARTDAIFERQAGLSRHVLLDQKPIRAARWAGGQIENHARATNFVTWIERGLLPEEAALRTKRVLFDYDALSNAEKQWFRRLFPFYTWSKKNISLQAHYLRTKPGLSLAQLKPMSAGERGPDESLLPDYLEGRFKIKVQRKRNVSYLTGIDLPITSAIETLNLKEMLPMVNPVLKTIIEMGTGQNLFTGRSIEERERLRAFGYAMRKAPEPLKQYLEFEETVGPDGLPEFTMNGTKAYLIFKSFALARLYSTARRLDDPLDSWALQTLTGLGIKEFDLSKSEEIELRHRLRRLEENLKRRGKLKAFEVTYQPKR